MKKSFGFVFCICCLAYNLSAQYYNEKNGGNENTFNKNSIRQWVDKGDLHLRWYPFGFLNFYDMNLTLGGEYSYAPNKSVILDVGYIMASILGNESGDLKPASGLIFKTSHRWYYGKRNQASFVDAEAGFKTARYQGGDQWVGRGVVDGVPAYEELMAVSSQKDVFTLGARMGKRIQFSPPSAVGLELWLGLGIRYRHYYPDLPDDAQVITPAAFIFDPFNYEESWLPDIQMGLRLTFRAKPD